MDEQPQEIRLSDTERDAVVKQLQAASAEGRITLDEFGERSRQVYEAKFPSELEHLTSDLPAVVAAPSAVPRPVTEPVTPSQQQPAGKRRWFLQLMGGASRSGKWNAEPPITSITVMGGQDIDLTEVDATNVTITAITVMGGTDIVVPDGARVDLGGFMLFGGLSDESRAQGDSQMQVTIRAWGGMGACEVRNLSAKERKKRGR